LRYSSCFRSLAAPGLPAMFEVNDASFVAGIAVLVVVFTVLFGIAVWWIARDK